MSSMDLILTMLIIVAGIVAFTLLFIVVFRIDIAKRLLGIETPMQVEQKVAKKPHSKKR